MHKAARDRRPERLGPRSGPRHIATGARQVRTLEVPRQASPLATRKELGRRSRLAAGDSPEGRGAQARVWGRGEGQRKEGPGVRERLGNWRGGQGLWERPRGSRWEGGGRDLRGGSREGVGFLGIECRRGPVRRGRRRAQGMGPLGSQGR